jgi:hypothetical protein
MSSRNLLSRKTASELPIPLVESIFTAKGYFSPRNPPSGISF